MIRYDNNESGKREVAAEPPNQNEEKLERALRPKTLDDYIGQERVVEQIRITVQAAKMREEPVDHVLLHEEFNAAGVLADDLILVGFHLVPVDRRRFPLEAHGAKVVFCLVQHMGRVQQRLGGDAADVETGAAKGLAAFDDGGLQAQLGAADGADIAAGARADDDHVIGCHLDVLLLG